MLISILFISSMPKIRGKKGSKGFHTFLNDRTSFVPALSFSSLPSPKAVPKVFVFNFPYFHDEIGLPASGKVERSLVDLGRSHGRPHFGSALLSALCVVSTQAYLIIIFYCIFYHFK
jgi:hypothetical protein